MLESKNCSDSFSTLILMVNRHVVPTVFSALAASGIRAEEAVAFGVAAQALLMAAGAAFVLALGAWHAQGRLQQSAVAWQLRRTRTVG